MLVANGATYCVGSATRIVNGATPNEALWMQVPGYPLCAGTVAPVVTPALLASTFWGQVTLPAPRPKVGPGRAIVGRDTFLEGAVDLRPTYTRATPLGSLTLSVTGTLHVTWGDGAATTAAPGESGGPYPGGAVRHVYTRRGTVTVGVEATWTATWSLAGQGGTLTGLTTDGALPNLPVEEIQAVATG